MSRTHPNITWSQSEEQVLICFDLWRHGEAPQPSIKGQKPDVSTLAPLRMSDVEIIVEEQHVRLTTLLYSADFPLYGPVKALTTSKDSGNSSPDVKLSPNFNLRVKLNKRQKEGCPLLWPALLADAATEECKRRVKTDWDSKWSEDSVVTGQEDSKTSTRCIENVSMQLTIEEKDKVSIDAAPTPDWGEWFSVFQNYIGGRERQDLARELIDNEKLKKMVACKCEGRDYYLNVMTPAQRMYTLALMWNSVSIEERSSLLNGMVALAQGAKMESFSGFTTDSIRGAGATLDLDPQIYMDSGVTFNKKCVIHFSQLDSLRQHVVLTGLFHVLPECEKALIMETFT